MNEQEKALWLGKRLKTMRGARSIRSAAASSPLVSARRIRKFEAGRLFPDRMSLFCLLRTYLNGDSLAARMMMVALEIECLAGGEAEGLLERADALAWTYAGFGTFDPDGLAKRVRETGISDPRARRRIVAFLRGVPGQWGRVVGGRYQLEPINRTRPSRPQRVPPSTSLGRLSDRLADERLWKKLAVQTFTLAWCTLLARPVRFRRRAGMNA